MRISRLHFHRLLAHILILANRATQAAVLPRTHVPEEPAKRDTADTTCSLIVDISIGGDGSSQKTLVVPPCLAGVPLQVGVNIDLSDQGAGAQSSSVTSTSTTTSTAPPTTDPTSTTTSPPSSSTSGTSDPGDDCDDDPDDDDDSGSECSDDDDDCTCDDDGDGDPSSSSADPGSSHTATSTSPHPSSSSGPSSNTTDNDGQWYTGAATWYTQDDNAGACGKKYSDADHIVALSWKIFGGNGYDGPSCGKTIHIKTSAGKTGDAVVADECASCPDEYHVDMSTGLFKDLGLDEDTGEYQVQWSCPDCKFEEDPTIGGCKDDPNGQYC